MSTNDEKMIEFIQSKLKNIEFSIEAKDNMRKNGISAEEIVSQLSDIRKVWNVFENQYIVKTRKLLRIKIEAIQDDKLLIISVKSYRTARFLLVT